ncbi:MAG: hypothetical protein JSS98_09375 [Bacteroidetes bacterium]|nr:hypothetical protein [Bacteroidota bacterium]MBS1736794.1 hypothetical protein [Bacteroidota bacterium]
MEEFLKVLIRFFDQNNIPYMLWGSMAMSVYTVSRYTKDFDFIVYLKPSDIPRLKDFFKEGYYYDEDSIAEAIKKKGMFNIIDHASNYKADFIMLREDEFEQVKFNRRIQVLSSGTRIFVISLEDLLLSKLVWIQELESSLQATDITELSKLEAIDWPYVRKWIRILKLNTFDLFK